MMQSPRVTLVKLQAEGKSKINLSAHQRASVLIRNCLTNATSHFELR
jgi:hypothetical protein